MHFIHIPCGFLALLDLAVIKNRQLLLSQTPPFKSITLIYFAYVIFYLLVVHVNHAHTSQWPYGFMKELKTPLLWCRFVVVQSCILVVFLSIAVLTAFYSPVFWR